MARAADSLADPASFLDDDLVFGPDLAGDGHFVSAFVAAMRGLESVGVVASINDVLGD